MNRTCEKCIHYEVCRYPLEWRAFPDTCWKYEEPRPHGEWVCKGAVGNGTWCSVCDTNIKLFPNKYSFCPNCGADMRKESDPE